MSEVIRVYIGEGSTLDGGPFDNDVIETYHEVPPIELEDGQTEAYDIARLVNEMGRGQPGRIGGVAKDESFMWIEAECHDGLCFEADGHIASGDELSQSGDLRRRFARLFKHHGGDVFENNP